MLNLQYSSSQPVGTAGQVVNGQATKQGELLISESSLYKQMSASGLIKTGRGKAIGIIVSSNTSGTIKLWDALTATPAILVDTMTIASGERYIPLFGMSFETGLYCTIGNTAAITIAYN